MAISVNTNMHQVDAWGRTPSPVGCEKKSITTNPGEMIKEQALAHQDTLVQLAGISGFIGFIYLFFSDGDFSFLLTLSSILSLASFVKVAWVIMTKQSVDEQTVFKFQTKCGNIRIQFKVKIVF